MSKILVAEDEQGTRLIVKRLLEKEGHEVIEAGNGDVAYDLAMSETPDIGVLDIKMPGIDGFEVLRKLRQHRVTEGMPVVMLTAVPVERGESTALNFGASYYLPKPLDPTMLKMAVRSALRESAAPDKRSLEKAPSSTAIDDRTDLRESPAPNKRSLKKAPSSTTIDDPTDLRESAAPDKRSLENRPSSTAFDDPTDHLERSSPVRPWNDTAHPGSAIGVGDFQLDRKLGGGIPSGSLSLIEGESSAGKSVLCQHFAYSSLRAGHCVAYMTFEDTTQGLISKMDSLGMDVSDEFEMNRLRIYPLEEP